MVTLQGITLELLKFHGLYATVLTASGVDPNGFQQPATGERKVLRRKADVADRNLQLTSPAPPDGRFVCLMPPDARRNAHQCLTSILTFTHVLTSQGLSAQRANGQRSARG